MPVSIPDTIVAAHGGEAALRAAVAAFTAAKVAHTKTVNVPAPTADPLVEQIYYHGGTFTVVVTPGDSNTGTSSSRITPRQGKLQMLKMGLIDPADVIAGRLPTIISQMVDQLEPAQGAALIITWTDAVYWYRSDPLFTGGLLEAAASVLGVPATPELVDQFFLEASQL